MADIAKLKALAEAAESTTFHTEGFEQIAGVGQHYGGLIMHANDHTIIASCVMQPWADFIAAANPAAVLEMIAEIQRLEERNVYWIDQANTIARDRNTLRAERDQLKAENERLQSFETAYKEYSDKTDWVQENAHWSELGMHRADVLRKRCDDATSQLQAQADQLVKLMAENEALRKDADRLDRLEEECEAYGTDIHEGNRWVVDGPFATVRDAIDAAMSKEASQ